MRYGATHGHPLKIREKLCSIIRTLQGSGKGLMCLSFFEKIKEAGMIGLAERRNTILTLPINAGRTENQE
ncbi:hypothetical protein AY605_02615 [Acinetobacter sp. SFD]|nr:hypothetical protein AY605_02615 [Acinetobacter sp. SFD]